MNNKINLFTALYFFSSLIAIAQGNEMSVTNSDELKNKIVEKSKNTTSIICDFEQYKHLDFLSDDIKSVGVLIYKSPNTIKWEYRTPFNYSATFKNDSLYINDDGTKSTIDLGSNKTFKSFNNLIVKSISGDMFDDEKFVIEYFENNENYIIKFISIGKMLKKIVNKFVLTFDKNTLNVIQVKMIESSQDYTLLKFLNQQINQPVSDEVFTD